MKKSVWYHKLWNDKLNKVPIKTTSNSAWEGMEEILDRNLPKSPEIIDSTASFVKKIVKIFGYVSPVVIVGVIMLINTLERKKNPTINDKREERVFDSIESHLDIGREVIEQVVGEDTMPLFRSMDDRSTHLINYKSMVIKSDILLDRNVTTANSSIPIEEEKIDVYDNRVEGVFSRKDSTTIGHDREIQESSRSEQSKVTDKTAERKRRKGRRDWGDFTIVPYSYGIDVSTNLGRQGANLSVGLFSDFVLDDSWLINVGIQVNSKQNIEGEFSHPSFFRPDSLRYSFTVRDERKLFVLDVPLKLEYKVSELIGVNLGVIVNLPISQRSILTQLGPVADMRDTLFYGKEISSALANTSVNRINYGFSSGINVHFKRFDLRGSYQVLTPYRIYNSLGSFNHKNRYFRLGVAYRFK